MSNRPEVVTVDASNVDEHGFFCYKSKPKSSGYQWKLEWLRQRFTEGLRIKILWEGVRSFGFIEYIPGEYAWRAVEAPGHLVVHCLWVVGKGKGKGYGTLLLNECVDDARRMNKQGVVMLTSRGNWLANEKIFLKSGFECIDTAPPSFNLLVKRLQDGPSPSFPGDWGQRLAAYGSRTTVVYSDQCPYIPDAVSQAVEAFGKRGIETTVVKLESAEAVRRKSPSPYGVFGIVWDGELFTYHYLGKKELRRLDEELLSRS